MEALATFWFVVLCITLVLFAGLLVGGTIFGFGDLKALLVGLRLEHEGMADDASDDPGGEADEEPFPT